MAERENNNGGGAATGHRVFLGWDRPDPLGAAADWLLDEHGSDLSGLCVALPGRRATRRLLERLVQATADRPDFVPPEIVTAGRLTDRLVAVNGRVASRLLRTVTWLEALRTTKDLAALVPQRPGPEDLAAWAALAEVVQRLHAELGRDALDFRDVERLVRDAPGGVEAERWGVLVDVAQRYRAALAAFEDGAGRLDPHDARRTAVTGPNDGADGALTLDRDAAVVLIGVVDPPGLLRRVLERRPEHVTALIFAPEDRGAAFDELGALVVSARADVNVVIPDRAADGMPTWSVVDKPEHQADRVMELLTQLGSEASPVAAEDVTIGVPYEPVVTYLERRCASAGIPTRIAAGELVGGSSPVRLLAAVASWLQDGSYDGYAELVRHPVLQDALRDENDLDVAAALDEYHAAHLPATISRTKLGWDRRHAALAAWHARLVARLGPLLGTRPRPLREWVDPLVAFVGGVYTEPLDPQDASDAPVLGALGVLGDRLAEMRAIGLVVTASVALRLLTDAVAAERLPLPRREAALEFLGWLELPLDDAPVLILTGFNDGWIPESVQGHAFLPDSLRRRLGVADNERRVARDSYALTAIVASGRRVHLISGRQSEDNDPLRPSRLMFRADDEVVVKRVEAFVGAAETNSQRAADEVPASSLGRTRPRRAVEPLPERLSVTALGEYLRSPYLFYLRYVLKLESVDDTDRELNPMAFGTLAHAVLEAFGKSDQAESEDEASISAFLKDALARQVKSAYGTSLLPAVTVQLRQLEQRLAAFARWQAGWHRAGWRIHETEQLRRVDFDVDGEPIVLSGKIDRIDVHTDGERWVILDYKTGESGASPKAVHGPGTDGSWRALQLPLYAELVTAPPRPGPAELGYVVLPKKLDDTGFSKALWTPEQRAAAIEVARGVVRDVRARRFDDVGKLSAGIEPVFAALAGVGLLAGSDDEP